MDTRFNSAIIRLLGICLLTLSASCSDDVIDTVGSQGQRITFAVADGGPRSRGVATGVGSSLSTVTLHAGDNQLYLIPEVTPAADAAPSRGSAVTGATIGSFGVYASINGSVGDAYYMDNVEVTKSNSWTPVKEYLWPGEGTLLVSAYSPYCADPADGAGEGITSLPVYGASELNYTVPSDVTAQSDLMWARHDDASVSPCLMTFNHALASVRFVTGAGMSPCKVKSITISGVLGSGTLDIETGEWSSLGSAAEYTAELNVTLAAQDGQGTVSENIAITDSVHTFMLIPQTLGEDASVTLVIDVDGTDYGFTASLGGQAWSAGNTYTYHLSANPVSDRMILTVDSPLKFNYTGGTQSFSVTSRHETMKDGGLVSEEVPWTAEFVDADGNVIDTPSWISSMPVSGDGSVDCKATTRMVEPDFVQMSEHTRRLRAASGVGSESAPYNLSNQTGASAVENTANCYVINAPGTYSIPLVYGNAIKDGADNTAAYVPTRSRAPFVNHLGNRIKHPYIYDNDGCSDINDAVLVWEGRLNMVRNVRLSADRKSLEFDIPAASIRQGNAVVGIRDGSGNIMWSWQLWVTDYRLGDNLYSMTYNGIEFKMMPLNLGRVYGGDEADFASSTALVRFTQTPPDGSEGKSVTVTIEQTGKHIITPDCHSFYQWGRKDPMISGIKEWYNADHTEITDIETRVLDTDNGTIGDEFSAELIKSPQTFWIFQSTGTPTFKYTNNWNLGSGTKRVKTVYDPSPVGYMVPGNEIMAFRDVSDTSLSYKPYGGYSEPSMFVFSNVAGVSEITFPALGYRSGKSGNETFTSSNGSIITDIWSSHANAHEASALILINNNGTITHSIPTDARLEGFAVRAINE